MNLLQVLRDRQIGGGLCTYSRIKRCLPKATVLLKDILDYDRTMLQGHVIMGFTWQGNYMVSYQLTIDYEVFDTTTHYYSIHWWKFNINKPLEHVYNVDIFKGLTVCDSVKLLLCQSIDQSYITIFGYTDTSDTSCTCYISIVSTPLATPTNRHTSIHITYEVFPPLPVIIPSLCLSIENCVLINTGCGLYSIRHNVGSNSSCNHDYQCSRNYDYQCIDPQVTDNSLTRSLQIEVYLNNDVITNDTINSNIDQRNIDIEQWLYDQLSIIYSTDSNNNTLQSIINYDVQLLEVYKERYIVIFIIIALVEVVSQQSITSQCTVTIMAQWNINKNTIQLLLYTISSETSTRVWNPGRLLVSHIRKRTHPYHTSYLQVFSNHTVSTGKSLSVLHHPYLPISLILN